MSALGPGGKVPDFTLPATGGTPIRLSDFLGHKVVLYFYPKDNTPGCTREGQAFRDLHVEFERAQTVVMGISRDSVQSHENFRSRQGLPFPLLSDRDETVCRLFGVIKQKNMYGRQVRGIERSTFLLDRQGVLRREWRKVKVDNHAQEVLEAAKSLE